MHISFRNWRSRIVQTPLWGLVLAVIATVLWSNKAIFIKFAYRYGVDANTLIFLRMLFALPFYIVVLYVLNKRQSNLNVREYIAIFFVGSCGYFCASILDIHALQYISVGLERMIIFTYPAIVVLLSIIFFNKYPSAKQYWALLFAFCGVLIIFFQDVLIDHSELWVYGYRFTYVTYGALLCFLSALFFAIYFVMSERWIIKVGSQRFTALSMISASSGVGIYFIAQQQWSDLYQPLPVYANAFAIAFFSTVIPSFMTAAAVRLIGAQQTSVISFVGPVSALIAAYLFLGEQINRLQCFGVAVVMLAMFLVVRDQRQRG